MSRGSKQGGSHGRRRRPPARDHRDRCGRVPVPAGVRERVLQRGSPRGAARGPQLTAARTARSVRGAAQRDGVHPAARGQPADLGLPDHAVRGAPEVLPHRQRDAAGHSVRRDRARPEPAPLGRPADACRRHRLHRRPVHDGRQRRPQDAQRDGRAPVRREPVHDRQVLHRRRRRAAVRTRARPGPAAHRAGAARRGARRDRGGAARHQVPGGTAGRARPRLPVRELWRRLRAARARPDRGERPGQRA